VERWPRRKRKGTENRNTGVAVAVRSNPSVGPVLADFRSATVVWKIICGVLPVAV
jgi:hypothetical protein